MEFAVLGAADHSSEVASRRADRPWRYRATSRSRLFRGRRPLSHTAAHDGGQLGALLDPDNTASGVWADTAYRSAANLDLLDRRGLKPKFQRAKPRRRPMPATSRQRPPRAGPGEGRARVRRPKAPLPTGDPYRRPRTGDGKAGAGEPRLQLHPARLDPGATCRRMTPQAARRPLIDGRSTPKPLPGPRPARRHRSACQPHAPNPPQNHVLRAVRMARRRAPTFRDRSGRKGYDISAARIEPGNQPTDDG